MTRHSEKDLGDGKYIWNITVFYETEPNQSFRELEIRATCNIRESAGEENFELVT